MDPRPRTDDSHEGTDSAESGKQQQSPIHVSPGPGYPQMVSMPAMGGHPPMMFAVPGGFGAPQPYGPRYMSPMMPVMCPPMADPRFGPHIPGQMFSVMPPMMQMPPMVSQPYMMSPYVLAPAPTVMPVPPPAGYMTYAVPPPGSPPPKAPSAELMPVSLHAPEVAQGKNPLPSEYEAINLEAICKEHLSRGCRHGTECQFIHLPEGYRPFPDQVCRDYVRGGASFCKRRKCRFFHGDASELQLAVEEVTASQHPREAVFVRHTGAAGTCSPMELVLLFQRIQTH